MLRSIILYCIISIPIGASQIRQTGEACYMCADNPNATISNPSVTINVTFLGLTGGVTSVTCQQLFDGGKGQFLTDEQCTAILTDEAGIQIQEDCGCSTSTGTASPIGVTQTPVPSPIATPTEPTPIAPTPNPVCYICYADPDATLTKPNAVVDISFLNLGGGVTDITCQQLDDAGTSGFLPVDSCNYIINESKIPTQCGCQRSGGTSVPTPATTTSQVTNRPSSSSNLRTDSPTNAVTSLPSMGSSDISTSSSSISATTSNTISPTYTYTPLPNMTGSPSAAESSDTPSFVPTNQINGTTSPTSPSSTSPFLTIVPTSSSPIPPFNSILPTTRNSEIPSTLPITRPTVINPLPTTPTTLTPTPPTTRPNATNTPSLAVTPTVTTTSAPTFVSTTRVSIPTRTPTVLTEPPVPPSRRNSSTPTLVRTPKILIPTRTPTFLTETPVPPSRRKPSNPRSPSANPSNNNGRKDNNGHNDDDNHSDDQEEKNDDDNNAIAGKSKTKTSQSSKKMKGDPSVNKSTKSSKKRSPKDKQRYHDEQIPKSKLHKRNKISLASLPVSDKKVLLRHKLVRPPSRRKPDKYNTRTTNNNHQPSMAVKTEKPINDNKNNNNTNTNNNEPIIIVKVNSHA